MSEERERPFRDAAPVRLGSYKRLDKYPILGRGGEYSEFPRRNDHVEIVASRETLFLSLG